MKKVKLSAVLPTLTGVLFWLIPRPVHATHLSGGDNDLMGLYGGAALVLSFLGLMGVLGLAPRGVRTFGRRWGKWSLLAGVVTLLAGAYHVSVLGADVETLGGSPWGRMAAQQIVGTLAVFGLFTGGVYIVAKRSGVLDMSEKVKYRIMQNGDPADATATRKARPGEERLMLIPFAAMGAAVLFFTAGVLVALSRLPQRP